MKILLPNEFHGGKGVLMVPHPSLNIALDCSDICGIIGMCMLNLYGFRVSYHQRQRIMNNSINVFIIQVIVRNVFSKLAIYKYQRNST